MKSYKLFVLGLFFIWSCAEEDVNSPSQSDVFIKYYGANANQAVDLATYTYLENDVEETGYMILAQNESDGIQSDFYLVRTDKYGNEVNSVIIDVAEADSASATSTVDIPKKIKPIGNGQFLVVGVISGSLNYLGAWIEIDTSLNSTNIHRVSDVETIDIIKTDDNEVIILGDQNERIVIRKLDFDDNLIWSSEVDFTGDDEALALFENPNGNLFIVGSSRAYEETEGINIFALETNSRGTAESSDGVPKILNESTASNDDIPTAVIATPWGYSITGYTLPNAQNGNEPQGFVVNVSRTANILYTHVFEFPSNSSNGGFESTWPQALTVDYAGFLSVVGRLPEFPGKQDEMMVMRIHPSLGLQESDYGSCRSFGRATGDDVANAVITHPLDGDLVIAGTVDFGSGTSLISLMKLSETGDLVD